MASISRAVHFRALPKKVQKALETYSLTHQLSSDISIAAAVKPYDNFASDVYRVSFSAAKTYILKVAPSDELQRRQYRSNSAFEREAFMYNNVFQKFESLTYKRPAEAVPEFITVPQVRAVNVSEPHEYALIQDMTKLGYTMNESKGVLSLPQACLAASRFAHLHAFSFYLREHEPEIFNKLVEPTSTIHWHSNLSTHMFAMANLRDNIIYLCQDKFTHANIERFLRFDYNDMIKPLAKFKDTHCLVHADPWINNLLFKYDSDNNVSDLCLVDWQVAFKAPPALDLAYLIYTSLDQATRDRHYEKLLETYYETLSEALAKFQIDVAKVFPVDVFYNQVREMSKFALGASVFSMHFMVASDRTVADTGYESFKSFGPLSYDFIDIAQKNPAYKVRISDVVKDVINRDII